MTTAELILQAERDGTVVVTAEQLRTLIERERAAVLSYIQDRQDIYGIGHIIQNIEDGHHYDPR